jgi:aromatic-L-amino-acid decarboxylase
LNELIKLNELNELNETRALPLFGVPDIESIINNISIDSFPHDPDSHDSDAKQPLGKRRSEDFPDDPPFHVREYALAVIRAHQVISIFSAVNGWARHMARPFAHSWEFHSSQKALKERLKEILEPFTPGFESELFSQSDHDYSELPESFSGCIERGFFIGLDQKEFARVYPQGIEDENLEKLIAHEIAHSLHVRVLNGREEAMGPIWFFEAFAVVASDQMSADWQSIPIEEILAVMTGPRGNYRLYGAALRWLLKCHVLSDLVYMAHLDGFTEWAGMEIRRIAIRTRDESELINSPLPTWKDDFRNWGRQALDWIVDYHQRVDAFPVHSTVEPGYLEKLMSSHAPVENCDFNETLMDLEKIILPGLTHWQSPNFFAYFPANTSPPSVIGDLISSGLAVQGMLWTTSPACTELESMVTDWVCRALALPDKFLNHPETVSEGKTQGGGVIQDSASGATLCAMIAAREKATGGTSRLQGVRSGLIAYTSVEAHSSVEKAAVICGTGRDNLRKIPCGEDLAMDPKKLEEALTRDLEQGLTPFFVSATLGTTSTMAFDDIISISRICEKFGVWLHVDSAMAGTAAICPEFRWILKGLDRVQSFCFNPHKWMLTGFDCDCFFVEDRIALTSSLSINPEYLKNSATESERVIDYRDWQISLGRRFRALKLWMVMRHYGISGIQSMVRRHISLTRWLADRIKAHPALELHKEPQLNLICFRVGVEKTDLAATGITNAGFENDQTCDSATIALFDRINETGKAYLTHTRIGGRFFIRVCIGQASTAISHVQALWSLISSILECGDN